MTIHKEGYGIISVSLLILLGLNVLVNLISGSSTWITIGFALISLGFWFFILWFFRSPKRVVIPDDHNIICPADGKVVVIEETLENEYFKDKRIQVSIFMSPLNVHENRYPVSGEVVYYKYHQGDYLVAWHPKSSTHNERTTIVVKAKNGLDLLVRQIAGAVARRVVCYSKDHGAVVQGETLGFIKFGSRVDLFLPLDVKLDIELNQKVTANKTVIGHW